MRFTSLLAAAPFLIAAAEPVRLQPASPWAVDYAAESCRLVREFGQGETATKLAFESAAPGSGMDMLVFGRPLQTFEERVDARLMPNGEDLGQGRVATTTTANSQPALLWPHIVLLPKAYRDLLDKRNHPQPGVRPPATSLADQRQEDEQRQALAKSTTELAIFTRRSRPVILETGSLGAPMAALAECSHDSLKDWGIDPAVEDQIVRPVWSTNSDKWLFPSDYPAKMLWQGKQSVIAVRLLVDAAGRITKCTPLTHINEPAFTAITCQRIQERARLLPAELADGTKVPSYFIQRVVFQMH